VDVGLRDRVVLITGAGGGVGPTLAEAFAREGARVALHHRGSTDRASRAESAAQAIRDAGGQARAVAADLRDADAIAAMLGEVEAHLGQVAVLVNATSAYRTDRFAEIADDAWAGVLDDMLGAAFRVSRAVAPGMVAAGWGRIVNVAARSGLTGVARAAHYAAAKAGIVGLTAAMAKELGPQGILVNAIAPTQILTSRDGTPSIPEEHQAELARTIPVRRIAVPSDLASLAVWLGSAANTYVNGEVISLTGGAQS
jgi:NAD(P)-dependent dehydrogenase (short-subunit alcohol dehydrogenase family)